MRNLEEAIQILLKYPACDGELTALHDQIMMGGPLPSQLSDDDAKRLEELFTSYDEREECWVFRT